MENKDIKNVIIPVISRSTQKKIADDVQKSFSLRKRSEELIKIAVRAVEIAIEKNEEKAVEYIEKNSQ